MAKQSTFPVVGEVEDLSTRDLLALAGDNKSVEQAAAARELVIAFVNGEHVEAIAGPGCPLVAEFCLAELGAVLGVSTTAAKKLVGHALELRHRLPRPTPRCRPAGSRRGGLG